MLPSDLSLKNFLGLILTVGEFITLFVEQKPVLEPITFLKMADVLTFHVVSKGIQYLNSPRGANTGKVLSYLAIA